MTDKKIEMRNILFHVLDGVFFMGAMVFLDQFTIMTAYIRNIIKNPLIISLFPAAVVIGFNLPGLFTASLIQRIQNKHLFISVIGIFQRLMILLLALFTLSFGYFSAVSAGLISALIYFLFCGTGGISVPAWLDLLARTVSRRRRSRVVALRNALGAGAGIIFPVLVAYILKAYEFPGNYRIIFIMAFAFLVISWVAFASIKDHKVPAVHITSAHKFMPFIKGLSKNDPNFVRFLLSRIVFGFCVITMSFFTVFFLAQNEGIEDSVVASFALALNISKIVGGLILGHIGDHRGNLLVYKLGIILIIPANILALYFSSLPVFYIVYILLGLSMSADVNTYQSFIGEFGDVHNRVYYSALGSSVAGAFAGLLPIAAGALLVVKHISFEDLFVFCAVISVVCFIFVHLFVKDPRHSERTLVPLPGEQNPGRIQGNQTDFLSGNTDVK